ncbi:uncharacterized protein BCR38DRAFT_120160 [Pseudomassariella vexata]|uniref:Uncharacterized protein n=1 Tax=Pseudomassariella vexata TaxID=1141098 RepID=A0A1Y2DA17_9PEZI|nr:uncharacterized protein BCR38DRAFT_120160 [Pseudomassariella vexata]ORY56110.1 hypothetical protein BCR38DRAFT_120160 [Pseudomassariella vexata]
MLENSRHAATPQTPQNPTRPQYHGDATPTPSPPASPSLSLYSMGMSPSSPLRRQVSAPRVMSSISPRSAADNSEYQDSTQYSKDVLIQRLNDLTARIAADDDGVQDDRLDSLHATVDEMEKVLGQTSSTKSLKHWPTSPSINNRVNGHGLSLGPPNMSKTQSCLSGISTGHRNPSAQNSLSPQLKGKATEPKSNPVSSTSSRRMQQVLGESQKLNEGLKTVVSCLKARQEERDHIHDLLITRLERAAQRIIYLEGRVNELECERNDGEMEILNLQIQLKAIEVQCLNYVPEDADPELLNSIESWKADWSALKRKRARRQDTEMLNTPTPKATRTHITRNLHDVRMHIWNWADQGTQSSCYTILRLDESSSTF